MRLTKSASPARRVLFLPAVASLVALAGCTTATRDNFTNPPPGPPPSCSQVSAAPGCSAGSLTYSCTNDRPDQGDTNLVCNDGTPAIGAEGSSPTLYCCAPYGQWASECGPATDVPGCGARSLGFSCSGPTSPDQADPWLVCSHALPGRPGAQDYCCVSFDPASGVCRCSAFDDDAGTCGAPVAVVACFGAAIGFACAAGHRPDEVNPLLDCAAADGGGEDAYCCRTP